MFLIIVGECNEMIIENNQDIQVFIYSLSIF